MAGSLHMADNGSAPAPSCDEVAPPTPPAAADIRCLGGGRAGPPAAAAPPPPATVSTTSPVAAAEQHAAACNAAAEEVRFDCHLALCSFTLLTATQVPCQHALALPASSALARPGIRCKAQSSTAQCAAPRPPPTIYLVPPSCFDCSACRCWPGPARVGALAASALHLFRRLHLHFSNRGPPGLPPVAAMGACSLPRRLLCLCAVAQGAK